MIDKFKKSRFGQIVITFSIAASVTASVVIWLYEDIRIPALSGQIALRDEKIKSLESQSPHVNELIAVITNNIEKQNPELTKEDRIPFSNTNRSPSTPASAGNFEQAVLSVSDQEDSAFLALDKNITELRLVSYFMYMQEVEAIRSKTPNRIEALAPFIATLSSNIRDYYDCRLTLEQLRTFSTQEILGHYRHLLVNFDKSEPGLFLSLVRQKSELLTKLTVLTKKLKANENSASWNTNAVSLINEFMGLTTNSPAIASPNNSVK